MEHLNLAQFLGLLFVTLVAAKLAGHLAQAMGQPSVLGELLAGVILGKSVLGLVDPSNETIHLMGELGVVILLFSIGLETDLGSLLKVGGTSVAVAIAGVVLPFALGFVLARGLGVAIPAAVVCGAALTATSVGITARVLSDLGRLQDPEGQVVLGAAILDDVIGLVILAVVAELADGRPVTFGGVARATAVAFGFLVVAVVVGRRIVPGLIDLLGRVGNTGTPALAALLLAFGLGWLADHVGSAVIVGAFAAGLLVVGSSRFRDVEAGVTRLGHFFVPLFFISVGAAVDVRVLNPFQTANHRTLAVAALLTAAAVVGKFASGYAPFWFRGRKNLIGAGMIPRGEVGLIFAQMGRAGGLLDEGLYAALTIVVLVTTFLAPPLLRYLAPPVAGRAAEKDHEGIEDLSTEA